MIDVKAIEAAAKAELEVENYREAVEECKRKLRLKKDRSIWDKIWPFKIIIMRKDRQ